MRLNHLLHIDEYPFALCLFPAQHLNQCIGLRLFKLLGKRNVQIIMTEVMSEFLSPVHVRSFVCFKDEQLVFAGMPSLALNACASFWMNRACDQICLPACPPITCAAHFSP